MTTIIISDNSLYNAHYSVIHCLLLLLFYIHDIDNKYFHLDLCLYLILLNLIFFICFVKKTERKYDCNK